MCEGLGGTWGPGEAFQPAGLCPVCRHQGRARQGLDLRGRPQHPAESDCFRLGEEGESQGPSFLADIRELFSGLPDFGWDAFTWSQSGCPLPLALPLSGELSQVQVTGSPPLILLLPTPSPPPLLPRNLCCLFSPGLRNNWALSEPQTSGCFRP